MLSIGSAQPRLGSLILFLFFSFGLRLSSLYNSDWSLSTVSATRVLGYRGAPQHSAGLVLLGFPSDPDHNHLHKALQNI